MEKKLKKYIDRYIWTKRGFFYLGEKKVEEVKTQRLLIDIQKFKAKIKRDGNDYQYIEHPKVLQPLINYIIKSY